MDPLHAGHELSALEVAAVAPVARDRNKKAKSSEEIIAEGRSF